MGEEGTEQEAQRHRGGREGERKEGTGTRGRGGGEQEGWGDRGVRTVAPVALSPGGIGGCDRRKGGVWSGFTAAGRHPALPHRRMSRTGQRRSCRSAALSRRRCGSGGGRTAPPCTYDDAEASGRPGAKPEASMRTAYLIVAARSARADWIILTASLPAALGVSCLLFRPLHLVRARRLGVPEANRPLSRPRARPRASHRVCVDIHGARVRRVWRRGGPLVALRGGAAGVG